ncbi:hypothetical protein JX265_004785 [Neoarthrinium moseri]|uniref:Glucose-methanol-choline oxidoreductase N-terminal domain-containing protein n=1 Tax=Neoarthrinium moseri TaxID=1658444 RepID=A0A9P9WQ44_9PEZI|nr:hypothetical protein JX266_007036 [Neoarthrinium moseri]KAI1874577.1 hypothetical protein JX265_004785 [Neoarthrinium moseri]
MAGFILIGGGTAGLAIAARLAPNFSVAVVEAGGVYETDNGNQSVVPYYALTMPLLSSDAATYLRQPLVDWSLVSVPQPGAGGRKIHYARGKTLGGSSALNTLAYLRGSKGTYDWWAELVGDESYRWDNVLPFFRKSCQFTPPDLEKRNAANATPYWDPDTCGVGGGPLQVSFANWVDPTIAWLAKALQGIGMPLGPTGLNAGLLNGLGDFVSSTIDPRHATRSSSAASYLREAIEETELMVYPHTQATKILFQDGKAMGVVVDTQGLEYTLNATKEVILSAGSIHSPQLLMISGIGPMSTLQSLGIPVIKDLPGVGQNLWEQLALNVQQGVNTSASTTFVSSPDPAVRQDILRQYLDDQAGPFSAAGGYSSFEKIPSSLRSNFSQSTIDKLADFPPDWPEIQYVPFGIPSGLVDPPTIGAFTATLLAPLSRGNVTITSPSVKEPPVIDLGWLSDPADGEVAVAALKRCREAWADPSTASIQVGPEIAPGVHAATDEQLLDYVRQTATTVWHASGTCKMGHSDGSDAMAVVDSQARVFGVQGLRVVDASVIPFAVPANPQGTVYMLAEKIADAILGA